jgi:putative peptidoglycan lipid II flippase
VLSVVGFPYLSALFARGDRLTVARIMAVAVRWTLVIFVPVAVVATSFARPLVAILFQRGQFDASAVGATSGVLAVYALGLPIFALEALIVPVFYAAGNTRTPALVGALCVVVDVASMAWLVPSHGINGIAASLVISKTTKMLILTGCVRQYVPLGFIDVARHAAALLAGLLPAALFALYARSGAPMTGDGVWFLFGRLAFASAVVISMFALCYHVASQLFMRGKGSSSDASTSS